MKRGLRSALTGFVFLLVLVLIAGAVVLVKTMPIGTGYAAKYICSSTFISGRDPAAVLAEDVAPVNPLARLVSIEIDRARRSVRAAALGLFPRTAIYREGCGCTLLAGTTEAQVRARRLLPAGFSRPLALEQPGLPWPEGDGGPVDPRPLGVDGQRLNAALESAFAESGAAKEKNTRAVLIVYRGRLVGERYAAGFGKQMPLLGWSMSKSITNALVGVLVGEGKLDIRRPAAVAEWQRPGDARQAITLDQLLRMSSGLAFEEVYDPFHDAARMLYASSDFAVYAAGRSLEAAPEEIWKYSSGTANIVARLVRQTLEPDYPNYYSALYEKFFDRIGMNSVIMEPDASGTFVGSSYTFATPRDWARFGLLYLQDGVWQGQRILPEGWVKYTRTPTPAAPRGEYGALFWLNAGGAGRPERRRWPDVPDDAYSAEGFQGQKVVIVPSRDLVVVRFGLTTGRGAWNTNRFLAEVLAALP